MGVAADIVSRPARGRRRAAWRRPPSRSPAWAPSALKRPLGPGAIPARQKTAVGPPQRLGPTLAGTAGETAARARAPARRSPLGSQSIGCRPEKDPRHSRHNGDADGRARSAPRCAARQKSRSRAPRCRGSAAIRTQGLRGGPEQQAIKHLLILIGDTSDRLRQGEDHVEVLGI
jgi:hypothetical protein